MPPKPAKKGADAASKKTEQKKKEKIIEDKTFGLKNKKGTKQQKFIKNVTTQVKFGNQKASKMEEMKKQETAKAKEAKKKEAEELNTLFRPVQTVGKGADPKSVLCAFFKQGACSKGAKCKFSHDLSLERKSEKKSVYDAQEEGEMMDWDEAKLEEVVSKKHGEKNKSLPATSIICKYFLDAVENSKYGWFWECPNGEKCHYKHALPPGFVLKKDQKKAEKVDEITIEELVEKEVDEITIEELVEKERAALGSNLTKVTLETFLKWKQKKRNEKIQKATAEKAKKKSDFSAGKIFGVSGREMFEFNPDLVVGDDDDADDGVFVREKIEEDEEDVGEVKEIDLEEMSRLAQEVDDTGTMRAAVPQENGTADLSEENKLSEAAALPTSPQEVTDEAICAAMAATVDGNDPLAGDVPIDENLFDGEDLDLIDDDLEHLDLDA